MKHLLNFLTTLLLLPCCLRAQSLGPAELNAAGHSVTVSGNTYEYAIGTVVGTPAYQASGLVVTPGVIQPHIATPNGVAETTIPGGSLAVYPNPVAQTLFLKPAFGKKGTLKYVLSDAAGRSLKTTAAPLEHGNELQEIPMSGYALGQYTLSVVWQEGGKTSTNTYKIQKIN